MVNLKTFIGLKRTVESHALSKCTNENNVQNEKKQINEMNQN